MNAVQRKHCGFVHAFQPSPSWQYACLIATTIHHVKVLGRKGCMVAPLFTPSFAGRTMARSVHPILSMSATTKGHSMEKIETVFGMSFDVDDGTADLSTLQNAAAELASDLGWMSHDDVRVREAASAMSTATTDGVRFQMEKIGTITGIL